MAKVMGSRALGLLLLLLVGGLGGCDKGGGAPAPVPTPAATAISPTPEKKAAAPAATEGSPDRLRISGSSAMAALVTAAASRFQATEKTAAKIEITGGGTDRGLSDLRDGKVDLAMISRSRGDGERDLQVFPIALDGMCLLVHRDNKVGSLTNEQIAGIYTARIKDWKEVGGKPGPITVVARSSGHAGAELFEDHFKIDHEQIKARLLVGDAEKTIKAVAANKGAIGYASIGMAADSLATHKSAIKLLPLQGVYPLTRNVRNHTFPLMRELNLVSQKQPKGLAERFLKYCLSPAVDDLIKEQFFVDVNE